MWLSQVLVFSLSTQGSGISGMVVLLVGLTLQHPCAQIKLLEYKIAEKGEQRKRVGKGKKKNVRTSDFMANSSYTSILIYMRVLFIEFLQVLLPPDSLKHKCLKALASLP